jgi:hypothetical protein
MNSLSKLTAAEIVQGMSKEALAEIASGKIDFNQEAYHELAKRGLDKRGIFRGVEKAISIYKWVFMVGED